MVCAIAVVGFVFVILSRREFCEFCVSDRQSEKRKIRTAKASLRRTKTLENVA